jgi:hypothetical protein
MFSWSALVSIVAVMTQSMWNPTKINTEVSHRDFVTREYYRGYFSDWGTDEPSLVGCPLVAPSS